jgi:integrase
MSDRPADCLTQVDEGPTLRATRQTGGRRANDPAPAQEGSAPMRSDSRRYTRHATRHRGLTYRERAKKGARTYYGFVNGKQVPVGSNESDALARYSELRAKSARGEQVAPANVRFGVVAEEWLESKRRLRPWTRKNYRAALDNVLLPRFGNFKLAQISTRHIAALIRELETKGLSRSYIDNLLKPLGGTYKFAMSRGLIGLSPMALLTEDERPPRKPRQVFEWSPESIEALLSASRDLAAKPTSRYDYTPLLTTAIRTGLRLGELLGLLWRDVDLTGDSPSLYVRQQMTRLGELAEPKTAKAIRRVPLGPSVVRFLAEHKLRLGAGDDDFVFAALSGGPLTHRNAQRRGFERAAEAAGLEGVTFHDLRHAFASLMIERGVSSTVLANLMGHTSPTTTERVYVHLFNRMRTDEQVREAMESAMAWESG